MSTGPGPVATHPGVAAPADVVSAVDAIGTHVSRLLDGLRESVSAAFAAGRPSRADLHVVEPATAMLRLPDLPLVGAGFVAAPGALADTAYWLEWFTTDHDVAQPVVEPLDAQTDPEADDFRDYTALAWFSGPRDDGEAHVTGPYVDYLCTDEYTLTFTQPVVVDGAFVGVVGADLFARSVEAAVLPVMGRLPGPSVLLNAAGRVVAACRSAWVTGDLVREVPEGWQRHACAALPFALLVAAA
ncbi:MAG: cache domain-containing protein [Angustibacter sp.]